jgi:hypothetical protein
LCIDCPSPDYPKITIIKTAGMTRIKIINAGQGAIHEYENTKRKLLLCNANIYFNKQCQHKRLVPNYTKIRIPGNTPATTSMARKARQLRIKEELKFLHKKKQYLNGKLYQIHLMLANLWGNNWQYIQSTMDSKLQH